MDLQALQQGYAAKTWSSVPTKTTQEKKKKKPKISLFETLSLSFCLSAEPKQSKARKIEISKEFMKTDWGIYRKQVLMVTVHLWDTYQRRTKLTTGNAR